MKKKEMEGGSFSGGVTKGQEAKLPLHTPPLSTTTQRYQP
jgi:hypothetical protein